jgi:hypothetical protein
VGSGWVRHGVRGRHLRRSGGSATPSPGESTSIAPGRCGSRRRNLKDLELVGDAARARQPHGLADLAHARWVALALQRDTNDLKHFALARGAWTRRPSCRAPRSGPRLGPYCGRRCPSRSVSPAAVAAWISQASRMILSIVAVLELSYRA